MRRKHKINKDITYSQVRLIGQGEPQIVNTFETMKMANSEGKDLILISESSNPPIVKIEEYSKFLYQQEKAEKERKKKSSKTELREIQLSVNIADNDILTKSKKAKEFLLDDDKVKCVIQLKGRQKAMPEQGELVMLKFANILADIGSPEAIPKLDGGRWIMIIRPKSKK